MAGANNFVRTTTEPDNQDQADFRLDHYFGERHRVFGRYTSFRDDDTPVTPLPDGSGSLTSGVTGHAITRGDAIAGDYNLVLSPSMLNQFRAGYSRRELNQTSLQDGGILVPGLPANSFGQVLPTFTVAGLQQLGPTTAANSNFTTSVTEFLDTFTSARGRHTIKFGTDIRREALDVVNPPNPTGSFGFTTTGSNSAAVAGSGNAVASLLLGQVNAFTLDIQKNVIQPRAHIAEFFVGDDWKMSSRLTVNIGTRYTLNFPSTEKHDQGGVFNLKTQVLDFPHTAREVHYGDFGPRVGLAYRVGNSWVVRVGLRPDVLRAVGDYDAVHDPAVPVCPDGGAAVAGQCDRGLCIVERPISAGHRAESEFGFGTGRVRRRSAKRVGLFAAVEPDCAEDTRHELEL